MDLHLQYFARLLQTLNTHEGVHQGRQLHLLFLKRGLLNSTLTIGNRLLQMYTKCGYLVDARNLFDEMPATNSFTWNTMIEGYMKSGDKGNSLKLFNLMPQKNDFSWNLLVSGFAKAGELEIARELFEHMPRRNGIAWNCMIHGYAKKGYPNESLRLFMDLNSDPSDSSCADTFILATAIGVCTDMLALDLGKQIHARIVVIDGHLDNVLGSSLVNMYGKCSEFDSANHILNMLQDPDDFSLSALISGYSSCGRMNDARKIFNIRTQPCVVLWNTLISGYIASDKPIEALVLYALMRRKGVKEDSSTFGSILSACSSLCITEYSKQMHAHTSKFGNCNDLIVVTALVDAYAKCYNTNDACKLFSELNIYDTILLNSMITIYFNCGRIEEAKRIFDTMPYKTLISWNSMIVGYSQNGCAIEALNLFYNMNKIGLRTDKFSLGSAISACANISSLVLGEQIFCRATITGLLFDRIVSTSLIDFYCKCGIVQSASKLFDEIPKLDEVPWNVMLMGYATNGYGNKALNLFDEMRRLNVSPTDITFTAVLSACNHGGLVDEGEKWFNSMSDTYHIEPVIEHYSCMVDLFSRLNFLDKAMHLIKQMPFDADASLWLSVLRGCVIHGNNIMGKIVAEKIKILEPENSGAYVQLSAIFATTGDWENSAEVRKVMRDKRIRKDPGMSWNDS